MSAISGFSSLGSWPDRVPSVFRTEPDSIPGGGGDASPIRPSVAGSGHHVDCLQALWALLHVELDFRSLLEAAVSFSLNCREMYEHILSARALDESESLGVVEPLYSALLSHFKTPEYSLEYSLLLGWLAPGCLIYRRRIRGVREGVLRFREKQSGSPGRAAYVTPLLHTVKAAEREQPDFIGIHRCRLPLSAPSESDRS